MNSKDKIILSAIIVFVVLIGIFIAKSDFKPKEIYTWGKTYTDSEKQPYDFGLFKELLKDKSNNKFFEIRKDIKDALNYRQDKDSSTYVFIGRNAFYTHDEINALMDFTANGSTAIIVSEWLPDTLISIFSEFGKPIELKPITQNSVFVEFNQNQYPKKRFFFRYRGENKNEDQNTNWTVINENKQLSYFYEDTYDRYIELSNLDGEANCIQIKNGKGKIIYHSNPLLFTNYFLNNDSGFLHLNQVLNQTPLNQIIYDVSSRNYKRESAKQISPGDTPLSYILKQKPLKFAWYTLLLTILFYFIFRAKRKQRIIPVIEPKRNTSLKYLETISGMYFKEGNHKQIAVTKMTLFNSFIRNKINVSTSEINDKIIELIATKSKVDIDKVKSIYNYYQNIIEPSNKISSTQLIEFHSHIEQFNHQYNQYQNK